MSKTIKVPKKEGEKTRKLLRDLKILDLDYEIDKDKENLYFPLKNDLTEKQKSKIKEKLKKFEIIQKTDFEEKKQKPNNLKEALETKLNREELKKIPSSFDILGDIAVLEISEEIIEKKEIIGKALLEVQTNLNTVLLQKSPVSGEYRVKDLEVIAGEPKTHTIHKEHGCKFHIDLDKVFYSPRLTREREIITKQVRSKETVFDMFTGVGPFSILIAKKRNPKKVYAVDKNKEAIKLLKKNIKLNNVEEKIKPIRGDIRKIAPKYKNSSNRAIMNLPFKSGSFLKEAINLIKKEGGIINYYDIRKEEDLFEGAVNDIKEKSNKKGYKAKVLDKRIVRSYSPNIWNIAIDIKLSRKRK